MSFSAFPLTHPLGPRTEDGIGLVPFSAGTDLSSSNALIQGGIPLGGKTENEFSDSKPSGSNRYGFRHFPRGVRKNSEHGFRPVDNGRVGRRRP